MCLSTARSAMPDRIYLIDANSSLRALTEAPYENEDLLQDLVARNPALLDGEQISPGAPRSWLLVRREMGVPDAEDSGDRWSVDHLFLDQDAIPTFVEVKRASNGELRRTIVGQMLDYASNATVYWPAERIRATFEAECEARGEDPAETLASVISNGDTEPDIEAYWTQVDTNLRASRLRLLFVADQIPTELQRIVEFLNAQMSTVDVLAVELKQFAAGNLRTLVPRVFGLSAAVTKRGTHASTIREPEFLDGFPVDQRATAEFLLNAGRDAGVLFGWGSRGVSLRVRTPARSQPVSIAWLYPPGQLGWISTRDLTFGAPLWIEDDQITALLDSYQMRFRDGPGSDASSKEIAAWSMTADQVEPLKDEIASRIRQVTADLQALPPHDT
jgi:hypothetical protein